MKRALLFFAIFIVLVISFITIVHFEAVKVVYECRSFFVDNTCVTKKIDNEIDTNQKKAATLLFQFSSLRRLSLVGGDFRIYSSSLHRLGHKFFLNQYSFDHIEDICPALIKDGCVHGYVMEFINKNDLQKGIKLCSTATSKRIKLGCTHALGHSYLEFNNQSVDQAIKSFCKNYSDLEYAACVSGLFHENSKLGEGMGHENYYQRPHTYNSISCDNFIDNDYTICYGSQGSFRQYFPESESIKITLKICSEAKTQEAKESCKYNALQRLDIARGYSAIIH